MGTRMSSTSSWTSRGGGGVKRDTTKATTKFTAMPKVPMPSGEIPKRSWAFVPPRNPTTPEVTNRNWSQQKIDLHIMRRLETEQLAPSPDADRRTLIRRLAFDLTGLPLSPDEIGYAAVESRLGAPDPMAAILHVLGLDHNRLTFNLQGIEETLTDSKVTEARVVEELLV